MRPRAPRGRLGVGAALVAAVACAGTPCEARLLLVQTPDGPVYRDFPEPAGTQLPRPSARASAFRDLVDGASVRHGVDPHLVEAIIACESDFDVRAVSSAGAQGLMQLMPATAARYGCADPFDADANVDAGTRHLRDLLAEFGGDVLLVAAAYNAGAGAVRRAGGVPPYAETRHYVRKVQHYLSLLAGTTLQVASASLPAADAPWDAGAAATTPEPQPEPVKAEPPPRPGARVVMARDEQGRLVFTTQPVRRGR